MVFSVDVLDLDFLGPNWFNRRTKSRATLWVLETCPASSLYDHLYPCFVIFKHIQLPDEKICTDQSFHEISFAFEVCEVLNELHVGSDTDLPVLYNSDTCSQELQQRGPIIPEQANRPISSQCPKRWFLILLNCAKLKFASYTSNLWEQNVWLPKMQCSSRSGFWIFKISSEIRVLKQSQSALFSSITHMTILFVFTCVMNVWNQSIQAFVTGFGPFRNRIVQTYSLTIEYQVVQYVPSISISEQFESILVTILQKISFLLL